MYNKANLGVCNMTPAQAMFFLCLIIGGLIINVLALIVNTVAIWVAITQADRTLDRAQKRKDARKLTWRYFYEKDNFIGNINRGYESTPPNGYRYIIGQLTELKRDAFNNKTQRIGHKLIIINQNDDEFYVSHYNENINVLFDIANYHYYDFDLASKKVSGGAIKKEK